MGFLKLLGLSKVNEAFMKPISDKLEEIEGSLGSIGEASESSSKIVDALKAKDMNKAVEAVLEFYELDDTATELKGIKEKVDKGEKLEAAVSAGNAAALAPEVLEVVKSKLSDTLESIKALVPSIGELGTTIADKLKNIKSEVSSMSFAEKVGTPLALKDTASKAKSIKETAEETKGQLEQLKDSLANLAK
jgi:hypothetical protein